jgi:lipoprotein-anchoring transpeptidase ErfK/SrfK
MTTFLGAALVVLSVVAPRQQQQPADQRAIAVQVALDRAGFSVGVIDGRIGANTRRATEAYRAQNGRDPEPHAEPLTQYEITQADVAGPFVGPIPKDLMAQSKLPSLGYQSADEAIAERFHTTPEVLRRLNPDATFAAGDAIMVPNVDPLVLPQSTHTNSAGQGNQSPRPEGTSGRGVAGRATGQQGAAQNNTVVRISRSASSLTATDSGGRIVLFAPVTTGSERDPLPIGEWKVNVVQYNPPFRYNPDLFWDADPSHSKATIPPGPNGPVGVVWIDISKEHYGLHGTPEPAQIGRTQSHGCVRLTNWDALRLAALVGPGTKVIFTE